MTSQGYFGCFTREGINPQISYIHYQILSRKGMFLKRGKVLSIKNYPLPERTWTLLGTQIDPGSLQRLARTNSRRFEVGQVFLRKLIFEDYPTQIYSTPEKGMDWFFRKVVFELTKHWIPRKTDCPNTYYGNIEISARKFSVLQHVRRGRIGCVALETEGFTKRCGGIFDFTIRHGNWDSIAKLIRLGFTSEGVILISTNGYAGDELFVRYSKFEDSLPKPKRISRKYKHWSQIKSWDDIDETCSSFDLKRLFEKTSAPPPERVVQLNIWNKAFSYMLYHSFDNAILREKLLSYSPESKKIFHALCWSAPENVEVFKRLYLLLSPKHQEKYAWSYFYTLRDCRADLEIVQSMFEILNHDIHLIVDKYGNSLLKICTALRQNDAILEIQKSTLKFAQMQIDRKKAHFQPIFNEFQLAPPGIYPGFLRAGGLMYSTPLQSYKITSIKRKSKFRY